MKYTVVCFPLIVQVVYGFSEYDAVSQYYQMLNLPKNTNQSLVIVAK